MQCSLVLICALALTGCAATSADALAPLPYTAAQIRSGHPTGTLVRFRIEAQGQPTVERSTWFRDVTADDVLVESVLEDGAGTQLGEVQSGRAAWEELRMHAAFPAATTVRTRATCTVPAGTYDCWLYTVRGEDGSVQRFWFALDKPGPPVRLEVEQDGAIVTTMSLLSYEPG